MSSTTLLNSVNKLSLRQIKNIVLIVILASLFIISQAYAAEINNISGIKKDIKIISKVLESSTELNGTRSKLKVSGNYLAKQGIVLNIRFPRTSRNRLFFGDYNDFTPVPDVFSEGELEQIQEDAMAYANDALVKVEAPEAPIAPQIAFSVFPGAGGSEKSKQLRQQQRELRNQQRAMEKSMREIERSANKETNKKVQEKIKKKQKMIKELRKKMKLKSQQIKKESLALRAAKQKKHNSNTKIWTNSLVENFCSYSPYPRNLPKNERLTLVIKNAIYVNKHLQDRVLVLTNKQLISCRDGKMQGKDLLTKAINYIY